MGRLWLVLGAVVLSVGSAALGYRYAKGRAASHGGLQPAASEGRTIASFDDQQLDAAAFREWLQAEGPGAVARLSAAPVRKQYVEAWARLELLAHRAETEGLADSPDERRERIRHLASLYVEKRFDESERRKPVTDQEARAYFEAHRSDYAHPETFEVAQVLFKAKDDADRAKARGRAQKALRDLQHNLPSQPYAFETLARQSSDDLVSASNGGRLAPMRREDLAHQFGVKGGEAIAALAAASPPVLVESDGGVYLVRLLRHEPAISPSFDTVAEAIKGRIRVTRKDPDYRAFISGLETDAHLHIDEAAVGALFTNGAKKP